MALKKLNLLLDYPVNWSKYKVFNNFVQNFYDALGPERYADGFHISFVNGVITLEADTSFSKEWLYYLGASTKRDGISNYAGRFGEGFKIAALCAYRDLKLEITMESQDWIIAVTEGKQMVAGIEKSVLAYEVKCRDYLDNSRLILKGTNDELYKVLLYEREQFFYDENPKFGEVIAKGRNYAIYRTKLKRTGGIFLNMQERVLFHCPIFFCNHNYLISGDDRERESLTERQIMEIVKSVVVQISAKEAFEIIELYKNQWFDYIERTYWHINWSEVIKILIDKISQNAEMRQSFKEKYVDLLVAEPNWKDYGNYYKKIAYEWFINSEYKSRKRVATEFMDLGIENMYELCERNDGFRWIMEPNDFESHRIKVLENVAEKFFSKIYVYDSLPKTRILINKQANVEGQADCIHITQKIKNDYGLAVKIKILNISIYKELIDKESFFTVLPVYIHELLHQFGGDTSINFHKALFEANLIMLEKRKEIGEYEKYW